MPEINELYGDKEAQQIQGYIDHYYSIKVPPPEQPTKQDLSFWKLAGFEAISFAIPSAAMVLFSSIRTGGYFLILEQKLLNRFGIDAIAVNLLSALVMVSALFGFEGYALARGMKKGRESMENKENWSGTIFTFIIITAVGIFSGLELVNDRMTETTKLIIDVFMAVITGLGAGVITFFGGNDIGIALKKFDLGRIKLQKDFQDRYNEWRESAVSSYIATKSKLNKSSGNQGNSGQQQQHQPNNQSNNKEKDWRKASVSFLIDDYINLANMDRSQMEDLAKEREFDVKTSENWKKNAQRWLMMNYIEQNKSFPSVEVIQSFGMGNKDAARFVIQHKDVLLRNSVITNEFVDMAEQTLNQ